MHACLCDLSRSEEIAERTSLRKCVEVVVWKKVVVIEEVKENCKLCIENASERLTLYIKAYTAEDMALAKGLISQAKSLSNTGNKLLKSIKSKQESIKWERIPVRFLKSYNQKNPEAALLGLETILGGMKTALESCSEFPVGILNSELKKDLNNLQEEVLKQVKVMALGNSIHPQSEDTCNDDKKFLQAFDTKTFSIIGSKDLPSMFFLFCLKHLLHSKSEAISPVANPSKQVPNDSQEKKCWLLSMVSSNGAGIKINKRRLMMALKSSLSLGFAVLFGLIYSKENGYWSGLPVAVSLASSREATFKVANIKAQGTVLGTVYGVLGCFIFEKYANLRFISLLPWFIFCSFLRQSRMYGQAGGVCAVIGGVLILGRKNFGEPSDFAIARIVETFIGLSCSIMVDVLVQPTRAAVLAKAQLSKCFHVLHETITSTLDSSRDCSVDDGIKRIKSQINELAKSIEEAESEPNFWFLPLNVASYRTIRSSLAKAADFLQFMNLALTPLERDFESTETDLKVFKEAIGREVMCLEEVSLVESVATVESEYEKRRMNADLEMGECAGKSCRVIRWPEWSGRSEFLLRRRNLAGEETLCLGAAAFCMNALWKETKEMEKQMREIVQWENPQCT
ncbi:uncharacterized protein LOC127265775 isoform X2 [Andrographis paniculata]|uniref:uncharacterized protein LOC127265775 isoform X2 n=1 Tax=Andrographis paniculata TaxID=175694 RepID=UPI0021E8C364|nr:uncharacterized protein LOC127265775 isoform X2 [Andrographis paniculata]XP_051151722.1 uncharacterized protein LOC127265775 isoform X2 [Andrographis paniculata]XP_051151723.1 uncharacterized protein LOC127265775 isoform X2 [Andrographis paniculata]